MGATLVGLLLLANAGSYLMLLLAATMVGAGSAVFHPEASRVARMASGGRHGLAQSLFQVGGNVGSSLGPILAALIVIPRGQGSIGWFSAVALLAMVVLVGVGNWHWQRASLPRRAGHAPAVTTAGAHGSVAPQGRLVAGDPVGAGLLQIVLPDQSRQLLHLLPDRANSASRSGEAQIYLFVFLASVALGTLVGGPLGDRIGRKAVIWGSILGVIPFTLAPASRQSVVDGDPDRRYRLDAGLRLLGDHRLRASTWCREGSARSPGCFLACRSALPGSARQRLAGWRTPPASILSISCAPSCR